MTITRTPWSMSADEPPAMADGGRMDEVRDLVVVNGRLDLDLFDQVPQARAQDDAGMRLFVPVLANGGSCRVDLLVQVQHSLTRCPMSLRLRWLGVHTPSVADTQQPVELRTAWQAWVAFLAVAEWLECPGGVPPNRWPLAMYS